MLADDNAAVIASAVTAWKRTCAGHRSLKICESFQSAASGAATVITLATVSRLLPSTRPPRPASAWDICASDRLDGPTATLLGTTGLMPQVAWSSRLAALTGSPALQ